MSSEIFFKEITVPQLDEPQSTTFNNTNHNRVMPTKKKWAKHIRDEIDIQRKSINNILTSLERSNLKMNLGDLSVSTMENQKLNPFNMSHH